MNPRRGDACRRLDSTKIALTETEKIEGEDMGLSLDSSLCNACRMCELACSFHHRGVFAPHRSSVKVTSDFREGRIQLAIDSSCDLCPKEPRPLCVEYCLTGALKKEEAHERA